MYLAKNFVFQNPPSPQPSFSAFWIQNPSSSPSLRISSASPLIALEAARLSSHCSAGSRAPLLWVSPRLSSHCSAGSRAPLPWVSPLLSSHCSVGSRLSSPLLSSEFSSLSSPLIALDAGRLFSFKVWNTTTLELGFRVYKMFGLLELSSGLDCMYWARV